MTVKFSGSLFGYNTFQEVAEKAAKEVQRKTLLRAKALTPVDTGRLMLGWKSELSQGVLKFYNNTPYAKFVFYGTSKMRARPAAVNAVINAKEEYIKTYTKMLAKDVVRTLVGKRKR